MGKGCILLSAGGTGGHLFPAEALAHILIARGWRIHLATDSRGARFAGDFPAEAIHAIPSATMASRNPVSLARAFWSIWTGARVAGSVIAAIKPKAVIGFGGYPTLPPLWAATRRDVPTIIHEQNAVMGRANKALAGRVTAIAGGFLQARGRNADRIVEVGNPVRQGVLDVASIPYKGIEEGGPIHLLVFGGSQGARYFSDMVPDLLAALPADLRRRLVVTQQARTEDEERLRARYHALDIMADVAVFFKDLPARMAASHLVISRAGASTVLELSIIGRPAILVPLPYALDDDQGHNARILVDAGGAVMRREQEIDTTILAGELAALLADEPRLAAMARAARQIGRPDAARTLADLAEAIAAGETVQEFKRRMHA